MPRPNLFQFATSELSQDAFLCWLLAWADAKHAEDDEALHQAGQRLISALLAKHSVKIDAPANVEIRRQHSRVDITAIIDDRLLLLIEDKINAGVHGDQLTRYAADLANQFPHCRVLPIFFKTGDQSDYEEIEKAGYRTFLRRDLLAVLQSERSKVDNAIFEDFLAALESLEALVASYATLPVPDWSRESWKGFYKQLQTEIPKLGWDYVPNASGGFMGAWWHFSEEEGCTVYLQIEKDGILCFKIRVKDEADRSTLRRQWSEKLINVAKETFELPLKRPGRFGTGDTMTVAVVDKAAWLVTREDGLLNLDSTLANLKNAETLLDFARLKKAD